MQYKHIFFDLDHTLWDFDRNARGALHEVYYQFDLRRIGALSPQHFIDVYMPINERMWGEYRQGKIDAETIKIARFKETFKKFGFLDGDTVKKVKSAYLEFLPRQGHLIEGVQSLLEYLKPKYFLHIVTNGFKAVSIEKLGHANINSFFKSSLSAEEVGYLKPDVRVFKTALKNNKARAEESLFVGDHLEADVIGAANAGMDQVYFNPKGKAHNFKPTFEISEMAELCELL